MLGNFSLVLVFLIVGAFFVFATLLSGRFFRPRNPGAVKAETYECGEPAVGSAWINFNIRFYQLALIFVIFDVEAALIFPVAAVYKGWISTRMGLVALIEVLLFVLILGVGLIYVWAKRDLEWVKKEN
jgi:NADH-quinone oxidoreductase subunit A